MNHKTRISAYFFAVILIVSLPIIVWLVQQQTRLASKADFNDSVAALSLVEKDSLRLYTADENEKAAAIATYGFRDGQQVLGKLYRTQVPATVPLYRFNTGSGYFYTGSEEEAQAVTQYQWVKEGVAGYVYPTQIEGSIALYRFRKDGAWALGTDAVGSTQLIKDGYTKDGSIGYMYSLEYQPPVPVEQKAKEQPDVVSPSPVSVSLNQQIPTQIGGFFFYWYDCPSASYQCSTANIPFLPTGYDQYSATKLSWFKQQFSQMNQAGIDIIIPVSWGSRHPSLSTLRDTQSLPLMVQALQENKSKQKIAMLDDTNSVVAEWNSDQGRAYSNPTENPAIPKMPLSNDQNWSYFYDRKIKPFYQLVPQSLWATHSGKSVDQGGRPLILIYDGARSFSDLEYSDEMWFAIKNAFKNDFNVEPFIILDYSWFDFNSQGEALAKQVDGKFVWAGGNDTVAKKYSLNNYTVASVDPGFVCPSWSIYQGCQSKDRHVNHLTGKRGNGERLRGTFQQATGSQLILVETWNELNEGSGIAPSDQFVGMNGRKLAPNFYINLLRSLKRQNNIGQ